MQAVTKHSRKWHTAEDLTGWLSTPNYFAPNIASFLGKPDVSNDIKHRLIQNRIPESSFKFPCRQYKSIWCMNPF